MPISRIEIQEVLQAGKARHYPHKFNLPPNNNNNPLSYEDLSFVAKYLVQGGVVILEDYSVGPYTTATKKFPCVALNKQGSVEHTFDDSFDGASWLLHWHYWPTMMFISNKLNENQSKGEE